MLGICKNFEVDGPGKYGDTPLEVSDESVGEILAVDTGDPERADKPPEGGGVCGNSGCGTGNVM